MCCAGAAASIDLLACPSLAPLQPVLCAGLLHSAHPGARPLLPPTRGRNCQGPRMLAVGLPAQVGAGPACPPLWRVVMGAALGVAGSCVLARGNDDARLLAVCCLRRCNVGAEPLMPFIAHPVNMCCACLCVRRSGAGGFLLPLSGGADSSSVAAIVGCMCQMVCAAVEGGDEEVLADAVRWAPGLGPRDHVLWTHCTLADCTPAAPSRHLLAPHTL